MLYGTTTLISRINENGKIFLLDIGVRNISLLTQKQVSEILSIQNTLRRAEGKRWQVVHQVGDILSKKKKHGGYFDIEKWKKRFFTS